VQKAFIEELGRMRVLHPGQVVTATALLKATPKPTADQAPCDSGSCALRAYDHYLRVMRAASA